MRILILEVLCWKAKNRKLVSGKDIFNHLELGMLNDFYVDWYLLMIGGFEATVIFVLATNRETRNMAQFPGVHGVLFRRKFFDDDIFNFKHFSPHCQAMWQS